MPTAYYFGPYRLAADSRQLERDGQRVSLTPKIVDTLFLLVENAGNVVTTENLLLSLWPDVNVVPSGLTRNISLLRKALDAAPGAIETIPRRGYRFVAPVRPECPATSSRRHSWLRAAAGFGAFLLDALRPRHHAASYNSQKRPC